MPVSVVIPNYNGARLLEKHLPKVLSACQKEDEIIVVDDASTDDSIQVLKTFSPRVTVVHLKVNQRFAKACNAGVNEASHDVVVLLNTDVSPQANTFNILESYFTDDDVFAVGCYERAGKVVSGRSCANFLRGMFVHARHPKQIDGYTAWTSGGSMAVRRSYWKKLDGMDALYRPAYYEDIDLSYRAWKQGWKVLFSESAKVDHFHESTNTAVFGRWNMDVMAHKNSFLFFWKNITDPGLWFSHIVWLPYHLLVGGIRSRGSLPLGFLRALSQVPEILQYKKKHKIVVRSDREIQQLIGRT